ncbi:MAG TPA: HepT-like ribonuclease domain-containing protein [Gammaproteobacteria bacterium]
MQPEDRDAAYLWDMLQAAGEVKMMMENHVLDAFLENHILLRAIERTIEIIGEAARRVSTSYMDAHPEIPWRQIIGQRNILVHEYGQIDHALLYKTAMEDIPVLINQLQVLLPPLDDAES